MGIRKITRSEDGTVYPKMAQDVVADWSRTADRAPATHGWQRNSE